MRNKEINWACDKYSTEHPKQSSTSLVKGKQQPLKNPTIDLVSNTKKKKYILHIDLDPKKFHEA
jgi:hypothetical protein